MSGKPLECRRGCGSGLSRCRRPGPAGSGYQGRGRTSANLKGSVARIDEATASQMT